MGELHFLDANFGWAPVYGSCATDATCVVVYVTADGGVTWTPRTDSPLQVHDDPNSQVFTAPVVRLASKDVGWLIDIDGNLYSTKDGARTWQAEETNGSVVALEAAGTDAWRLDQDCPSALNDACRYTLVILHDHQTWKAADPQPPIGDAGRSSLTPSLVHPTAGSAYILSDRGDYPQANHSGNPDGEWRPDPVLARTVDAGRTWVGLKPPCPDKREGGAWGADLAASTSADLWLVCRDVAGSGAMEPKHLHRSSDGGDRWGEDLGTPNAGSGGRTAAASPTRACRGGSRTGISCTRDGGRHWSFPNDGRDNPRDGGIEVYQFADPLHGWAIGQDNDSGNINVVWRTTDGGDSWSSTRIGPKESGMPASPSTPLTDNTCFGRQATYVGTEGDDSVTVDEHNSVVVMKGGNDSVRVTPNARRATKTGVYICLGPGDDKVIGGAIDELDGGLGNDYANLAICGTDIIYGVETVLANGYADDCPK